MWRWKVENTFRGMKICLLGQNVHRIVDGGKSGKGSRFQTDSFIVS